MEIAVAACLFLALLGAISLYGYRYYARPGKIYDQITKPVFEAEPDVATDTGSQPREFLVGILRRVGELVPVSQAETGQIRTQLVSAGHRSEAAVRVFYGSKVLLAVLLVLLALGFRSSLPFRGAFQFVALGMAGVVGYTAPGIGLHRLIKKRQKRLRLSLPDALDMMVVCVEAGLGLDQAINNVSRELYRAHKEICEELSFVNLEMRAGTRRLEALRSMSERTGVSEIRKLVAVLIQSDRFGTSISEALRTHSDFLRVKRRQEAEERANKVAVKLVFPIFFFILPSIVLVAVGPAILQVINVLLPAMRNIGE